MRLGLRLRLRRSEVEKQMYQFRHVTETVIPQSLQTSAGLILFRKARWDWGYHMLTPADCCYRVSQGARHTLTPEEMEAAERDEKRRCGRIIAERGPLAVRVVTCNADYAVDSPTFLQYMQCGWFSHCCLSAISEQKAT